jgi:hypothetical protein
VSELHEALEREDAQRVQPVRVQALADVLRIKLSEHVEHSQHLRYKLRTMCWCNMVNAMETRCIAALMA